MNSHTKEKFQEETDILLEDAVTSKLIIYNDEVNTFDWVIETLIDVCKHSFEQAEQCSLLIHYKGKYAVKTGELAILRPMKDAIIDRGINATIQ